MAKGSNNPPGAGDELRLLIERAERLDNEIAELKADRKDVIQEAKSRGFDGPTIQKVIKWRAMDPIKRKEGAALMEVYLAALGQSDGSLSDQARDFLEGKRRGAAADNDGQLDAFTPPPEPVKGDVSTDFGDDVSDAPITVDDARKLGTAAAKANKPVTANPFKAGDERRAAWDEAWCGALGSDGMDIPGYLQPTPKPGKGDGKGNDGGNSK